MAGATAGIMAGVAPGTAAGGRDVISRAAFLAARVFAQAGRHATHLRI
jgi:hypothetical protein